MDDPQTPSKCRVYMYSCPQYLLLKRNPTKIYLSKLLVYILAKLLFCGKNLLNGKSKMLHLLLAISQIESFLYSLQRISQIKVRTCITLPSYLDKDSSAPSFLA